MEACLEFYRDFCGLYVCHEREHGTVVWLSEKGREDDFVLVLLPGGPGRDQLKNDFSHLGFACASVEEVDQVEARAREAGCLVWPCREEPYPVGYYCGLKDPDGNCVEFSFGQPLGAQGQRL